MVSGISLYFNNHVYSVVFLWVNLVRPVLKHKSCFQGWEEAQRRGFRYEKDYCWEYFLSSNTLQVITVCLFWNVGNPDYIPPYCLWQETAFYKICKRLLGAYMLLSRWYETWKGNLRNISLQLGLWIVGTLGTPNPTLTQVNVKGEAK